MGGSDGSAATPAMAGGGAVCRAVLFFTHLGVISTPVTAGAPYQIFTANVTSLSPHWATLGALPWALAAFQEARIRLDEAVCRDFLRDGGDVAFFPGWR